mmetsp:Transcript_16426/g.34331  ORF Transcript_16426/g.34331 Transcript_16426/m.34331 type:complete len:805 (-) Transcript_16426:108-2522(-)|eukprot:CAMPEP_0171337958 /NCGR_PEP_ID=MMETSP0878-20121228/7020_1 /TAXON_ID=67004 /ORGANISM="Thalassiosira weissflogii, Strain CCMP1336" /LENGTH=804 /DNA_ID=CAMNT_0011839663 /DNA_START=321 /DNA_END=2735 /DNA_ORIENTATION=+
MGNSVVSHVLFHPPTPPTPLLPHQKYFWIETSTKLLIPAIFISNENNPNARFTLLYSHGHDVDLGLIYDFLVDLSRLLGVNVMSYDYGGYGMGMVKKKSVVLPSGSSKSRKGARGSKANRENCGASGKNGGGRRSQSSDNQHHNDEDLYETDSNSDSSYDSDDPTSPQVEIIQPSEQQCYADIEACHNYLVYNKGISPSHIILYGKSLGSGPTLWLAQKLYHRYFKCREAALSRQMSGQYNATMATMKKNGSDGSVASGGGKHGLKVQYYSSSSSLSLDGQSHIQMRTSPSEKAGGNGNDDANTMPVMPLAGVVLHGAFLSVMRTMLNMGFTPSGDCFPNADRIGDVKCPIYIIHAKEDEVIPLSHGKSLYEKIVLANGVKVFPPFWADDAAHSNIEQKYATAYVKRLQQFVKHCDIKVAQECGDNSGERVKYVRDRSLSVGKTTSFGGRVGSNISSKNSTSNGKRKIGITDNKNENKTTTNKNVQAKSTVKTNSRNNTVSKEIMSPQDMRGRSKSATRSANQLHGNMQRQRSSSRCRQMSPVEKRSTSSNRETQFGEESPQDGTISHVRSRTPSRAQARGKNQLSLTSSRSRGRTTVRDQSNSTHSNLAKSSNSNKKTLSKSIPSTVAANAKSSYSDARGLVAGTTKKTSRGRGRSRDARNCMQDPVEIQQSRSNSRARERKKRGTLVMKGNHEDEEFVKNYDGDGVAAGRASGRIANANSVQKKAAGVNAKTFPVSSSSAETIATVDSTDNGDWYDGFVYFKSPDDKALSSGNVGNQERANAPRLIAEQHAGTERECRNPVD